MGVGARVKVSFEQYLKLSRMTPTFRYTFSFLFSNWREHGVHLGIRRRVVPMCLHHFWQSGAEGEPRLLIFLNPHVQYVLRYLPSYLFRIADVT